MPCIYQKIVQGSMLMRPTWVSWLLLILLSAGCSNAWSLHTSDAIVMPILLGGLCLVLQLGVLCFLLVSKFCSRSLLKHYHCHTTFCCLVKRKTIPCLCTWLFIVCLMILIWPALLPYPMVHFVRSMWCSNTLSLLILTVYTRKKHTPRCKLL